jgi:hypothetical protein
MEAMKFKVVSPEHSAQIQKKLFAEGYAWSGYNKEVLHDKARHLFAKDACITYEMEDVEYFKDHPNEEYVLVDGNFVKAEEQFKSMKIALSDPFANRTHVANVLNSLGYKFCGDAEVYNSAKAFFTYDSGIIMKTDDMEYFKSHPNEEYVLVGDELKKASEWFKQPVTKLSFMQTAVDTFMAKYEHITAPLPYPAVTDDQIITKQKAVADKVLDKLFPIDPFAICAGGAPRDWYFGKPATDLDIFFYSAVNLTGVIEKMLEHVGIKINSVRTSENLPEWYQLNPHLHCVYETTVDGVNVQLMFMFKDTHTSVVPEFPFSICKAWYKDGKIILDRDFKACEKHNIIVKTGALYNDEHKYVQKIKAKFPDWHFCDTWEDAYKHAFLQG